MIKKRNKYGAKKTEVDGILFDSGREAKRFRELCLLKRAGAIQDLELQVRYKLFAGDVPIRFDSKRQAVYVADFRYLDVMSEEIIIEDSKGARTPEYKLKKAIMLTMGYKILES